MSSGRTAVAPCAAHVACSVVPVGLGREGQDGLRSVASDSRSSGQDTVIRNVFRSACVPDATVPAPRRGANKRRRGVPRRQPPAGTNDSRAPRVRGSWVERALRTASDAGLHASWTTASPPPRRPHRDPRLSAPRRPSRTQPADGAMCCHPVSAADIDRQLALVCLPVQDGVRPLPQLLPRCST